MEWTHSVPIDAPPDVVWGLVADVESWPRYISTVRSVTRLDEGPLRVGSSARIQQPGQPPAVWTVERLDPGREFSWSTARRGLRMTGTHRVVPDGPGCRNEIGLAGSGPLAVLLVPLARYVLRTENAGFRAEARRRVAA
ncbi:MAG: SRPBCC family protein [Pseudonocardia sp.]